MQCNPLQSPLIHPNPILNMVRNGRSDDVTSGQFPYLFKASRALISIDFKGKHHNWRQPALKKCNFVFKYGEFLQKQHVARVAPGIEIRFTKKPCQFASIFFSQIACQNK